MSHQECEPESGRSTTSPEVIDTLVANHRAFLAFLDSRLQDRALAEDILQDAFVRGAQRAEQLRDPDALVPWFYRMLRNAVIDHHRRGNSAHKALSQLARELEQEHAAGPAQDTICQCVTRLADTLKDEYQDALERIELEGLQVKDYAALVGITPNNAAIRVFRARAALRKRLLESCGTCATHGCFNCTCSETRC